MKYLILDIETVPGSGLPSPLEAEVAKRIKRKLEHADMPAEDMESLIRSTSPFLGRLLAVGMRFYDDANEESKDKVICTDDEKATLSAFLEVINHPASQQVRFVHYNGLNFDIPFILIRAAVHSLPIRNRRFLNLRRFSYDPHVDVMQFLSRWGREGVSLEVACLSFGLPSPKQGEVSGETVGKAFNEGNLKAVEEYVMRDVDATYLLFQRIRPYL